MEPVTCTGACTVTFVIESAPLTEEKMADYMSIFWSLVLVLVLVWGMKAMLNIFTKDNE